MFLNRLKGNMNEKDQIKKLTIEKPKHFSKMIKNQPELLQWVEDNCDKNCIDFATKIYTALNPSEQVLCPCGSNRPRKLKSIYDGFVFCGPAGKCSAAKLSVSTSCKNTMSTVSKKAKKTANKKRANTIKKNSGGLYSNNGQSPKAKSNHKKFYANPANVKRVTTQTSTTYKGKTGFTNPQQNPSVKNKSIKTTILNHGVPNWKQKHINPSTLIVLNDPILFAQQLTNYTVTQTVQMLGISRTTVLNYHKKYNLDLLSKSSYEDDLIVELKKHNIIYIRNNRTVLGGQELDIIINDHKLSIEIGSLYWHSEYQTNGKCNKNYHKNKYDICKQNGLQLLTIFGDEWTKKQNVIIKHILHLCNKTDKVIGARKLILKEITDKSHVKFLDDNHIQGSTNSLSIKIGAYLNGVLVSVVGLKKITEYEYDMARFATDFNASYPGLMSKFLTYIKNNYQNIKEIVTFADLRWSKGNVYEKTGFTKINDIQPDYHYTDYKDRFHKFNFRKDKIAKQYGLDVSKITEEQLMIDLGFDRIWDCGKIKYRKML